jgi:hypothetical protein
MKRLEDNKRVGFLKKLGYIRCTRNLAIKTAFANPQTQVGDLYPTSTDPRICKYKPNPIFLVMEISNL